MLVQLRNRKLSHEDTLKLLGKCAKYEDAPLQLTGDATVFKPDGKRLLLLRRNALSKEAIEPAFEFMWGMRSQKTNNRGNYAGEVALDHSPEFTNAPSMRGRVRLQQIKRDGTVSKTNRSATVASGVVGYMDRYPRIPFCRETAYTTSHPKEWAGAQKFLREVGDLFKTALPDRYEAQMKAANATHPAYIIPGTPFTTVTVNNTVAGAYHTDRGDFKDGFGVMAVFRKGTYRGANITFPEWGVSADMQHGDVIFFDSHEIHGNIPFESSLGKQGKDWIRISMVMYYRSKMGVCLSPEEELKRAKHLKGGFE